MDVHVPVAIKDDNKMFIAFMVSEKQIFTMLGIVAFPILFGNVYGRSGGMLNVLIVYLKLF